MESSTTYMFMCKSEHTVQLLKAVICALAGGYKLPTDKLCFVIVGKCDKQIETDIEAYQNAQNRLSKYKSILFVQKLENVKELYCADACNKEFKLLFQSNKNEDLKCVLCNLSLFDMSQVKADDKIVVYSQLQDFVSLSIVEWLKSCSPTKFVQHVCEYGFVTDELKRAMNDFLIEKYVDATTTILTGLHGHSNMTGMTLMQSAETMLCLNRHVVGGVPVTLGKQEQMYYTQCNLSSRHFANALCRIALIGKFKKLCNDVDTSISKWMKEMEVDNKKIWNEGEDFIILQTILSIYEDLMKEISSDHFQVIFDKNDLESFANFLNNIACNTSGQRENEKRHKRMMSILYSISQVFPNVDKKETQYEEWKRKTEIVPELFSIIVEHVHAFLAEPWEFTNLAFSKVFQSEEKAKAVRSKCLDMWEMFYRCKKDEIKKKYNVSENRTKTLSDEERNILKVCKVGRRILQEQSYFQIKEKGHSEIFSLTSPLTGFAFVDVEMVMNDSTEKKDLCERNEGLQSFIYNYTRCVGGFSDEFLCYIQQQIAQNKIFREDSKGKNLFKIYPKLREHVALTITNKNKEQ